MAPHVRIARSTARGEAPVTGPAVVAGPLLYGSPYPLGAEEITQVSGRLHG
ncbi:hypothetical protein ACGH52_38075 [Streptomyces sp. BBFR25]|uniref:hypothetical protein n=1 Tax=Streptomyces sp. BBFR25 TaxID=3372855 RepID=UPI0037DC1F47